MSWPSAVKFALRGEVRRQAGSKSAVPAL